MSSKTEMLTDLLIDLSRASQGNIQASLVIDSTQGLTICSYFPEDVDANSVPDEDVIAGRSTQILTETMKVFKQLKRGPFARMIVEGETGYILITNASQDALLSVLTNKKVNLGYVIFMMSRTARMIERILYG